MFVDDHCSLLIMFGADQCSLPINVHCWSLNPTQLVAEGIMFLTRPSVSQSESVSPDFLVSATPLKPLNRISLNFAVMKDIMCRCAYSQEIMIQLFFLRITPFLNLKIWTYWKILLKQFVSATPLKQLNRISWNFVVMKDIPRRCAYPQEIMIQFFFSELHPFWT